MNHNFTTSKRLITVYKALGSTFGIWVSPVFSGFLLFLLRIFISIGLFFDKLFYPSLRTKQLTNPVVIVGNPRSGTTFLHRFLIKNNIGAGAQLWQLLYPDRKSTRLNSSHKPTSYAVFCLKKTKTHQRFTD